MFVYIRIFIHKILIFVISFVFTYISYYYLFCVVELRISGFFWFESKERIKSKFYGNTYVDLTHSHKICLCIYNEDEWLERNW